MLNEAEREELHLHLTQRRQELIDEGDLAISPNRTDPTRPPDEDEQPLTEMNQVIASKRNRLRAQEIEGINRALYMLEHQPEDYGECEECGEMIPLGRLKIMPWASQCVVCLGRQEKLHKSTRRRHIFDYQE